MRNTVLLKMWICMMIAGAGWGAFTGIEQSSDMSTYSVTIKPKLSTADLLGHHWNTATVIFTRKGFEFLYHNYTIDANRQRWISKTKQLSAHDLKARALGYDLRASNYLWSRYDPIDNHHTIDLCYEDSIAYEKLHCSNVYPDAVERWNSRLKGRASVRFNLQPAKCFTDDKGNIPPLYRSVAIMYRQGIMGGSTTGAVPSTEAGEPPYSTRLDPDFYIADPSYGTPADIATHELGHVLGLWHEHQRPDAAAHIQYDPTHIDGHDTMLRILNTPIMWLDNHIGASGPISLQDMYTYGELSDSKLLPFRSRWNGRSYLPLTVNAQGQNALGLPALTQAIGAFDRDSIMLYATGSNRILRYKTSTGAADIPIRQDPSEGDTQAVIQLYPPLDAAAD